MSVVTESKTARKWAMPDTLVIIFFVAILTSIATWVVPVGMFDSQEVQYQVDGQTKTRKVVDPHSFRIVTNEAGEAQYHRVQFFTTGDERPGLMNFPFEGLTSGSKFGTAVGIIMFMLVIGGAFGIVMRIVVWIVATLIGLVFTLVYASRVKKNPLLSRVHESDRYFREQQDEVVQRPFTFGDWLVLLVLTGVMIWVVWGVIVHAWFIPEIASQFFTMGVVIGLIGVIFRLNGMTINVMASSFTEGARMMIAPALLVGFAKGILLLVGNGEAGEPSVLNTLLNSIAHGISGLNNAIAAWFMLLFQAVFNFFVTSGSGQAALTMPLLAPLGDLVGVNRQVTVLAFQFGDGFSHIIYPTSASLMATLGVCRVDFRNWLKVGASLLGLLFIMSSVVVIGAQMMGYH